MKQNPSGPQIFMNSTIVLCALAAAACFFFYYGGRTERDLVLWIGIVCTMIVYHFWLRLIFGNVTKLFKVDRNHWWFQERKFEKPLYQFLRVKAWKGRALTYRPQDFDLQTRSLSDIATTMCKSEIDHWINEAISVSSIFFALLWGEWWIFLLTALCAMVFDGQFIVIQRYNRPRVLRILKKQEAM